MEMITGIGYWYKNGYCEDSADITLEQERPHSHYSFIILFQNIRSLIYCHNGSRKKGNNYESVNNF